MGNKLQEKPIDLGLLILRIGIGVMFVYHGYGKLFAGPQMWEKIGGAVGYFGIHFAPTAWGLLASMSEFFGGLCLIFGILVRPAAFFMFITMLVASNMHLLHGDGLQTASHAIEDAVVFFSLMVMGAGSYSLDARKGVQKTK